MFEIDLSSAIPTLLRRDEVEIQCFRLRPACPDYLGIELHRDCAQTDDTLESFIR